MFGLYWVARSGMIFRLSDFSIALAAQCSRRNSPKAMADFTAIIVAQESMGLAPKNIIQESELQKQIIEKSQTIALPADWSKEMLEKLEREEKSPRSNLCKRLLILRKKLERTASFPKKLRLGISSRRMILPPNPLLAAPRGAASKPLRPQRKI